MKHIKHFDHLKDPSSRSLSKDQTEFLDRQVEGTWKFNLDTGKVDVVGHVDFHGMLLDSFKGISFGHVSGNFVCTDNRLYSLKGTPRVVGGDFKCGHNLLRTLEGGPEEVGGDYRCSYNELQSLKGVPAVVGGSFFCSANQITSLEDGPKVVGNFYTCRKNRLRSLKGVPESIEGGFNCSDNQLRSLEGGPKKVRDHYTCLLNPLESLEGAPLKVGAYFSCDGFQLTSEDWNPKGWLEKAISDPVSAQLLITLVPESELDAWVRENPLDLDLLNEFPEIKAGVLRRTGIKDISKVASALRKKFI